MSALESLAATIASRKGADPETSWTAKLLAAGPEKTAEKFGEEAVEAVIEAVHPPLWIADLGAGAGDYQSADANFRFHPLRHLHPACGGDNDLETGGVSGLQARMQSRDGRPIPVSITAHELTTGDRPLQATLHIPRNRLEKSISRCQRTNMNDVQTF